MYFYQLKINDNLTSIEKKYGRGVLGLNSLWFNNRSIDNPSLIYPGELINLNDFSTDTLLNRTYQ